MRTERETMPHELRVDETCTFQVYEATSGSLNTICQELARREGNGDHTASLVVSLAPLSSIESACLPTDVPWLTVNRTVADTLQILHENLVDPTLRPGLIGVDFADYANALSRGGEIHAWSAHGLNEAECAAHLIDAVKCQQTVAAACLHIRAPTWFDPGNVDKILASIANFWPTLFTDECLFVVAATLEERVDVGLSLMIVSGSGNE